MLEKIGFCAHCAIMLGNEPQPETCTNCGGRLSGNVIFGLFSREAAELLRHPLMEREDKTHEN